MRTASRSSSSPSLAMETVRLANLCSIYLSLMNSFLTTLHTELETAHPLRQLMDVNTEGMTTRTDAHMSLEAVGFGDGRLTSMVSLKLQFPTFLAS